MEVGEVIDTLGCSYTKPCGVNREFATEDAVKDT